MLCIYSRSLQTVFVCSVMLFLSCSFGSVHAESRILQLLDLQTNGDIQRVQIIVTFNTKPDYDAMFLSKPARLIINLQAADFAIRREKIQLHGFLEDVRYGLISVRYSRIIFSAKSSFRLKRMTAEPLQNHIWKLVIDLVSCSDREFEKTIHYQQSQITATRDSRDIIQSQSRERPFIVVIDAGHGDYDSGAIGISGVLEKDVTLTFARVLRDLLQRETDIYAWLTRDDDTFLRLSERIAIARHYGADLFISVHADYINIDSLRGTTVYTLSDDLAEELAEERGNNTDFLDGLPGAIEEIASILIDLTRQETQEFSIDFALRIIDSLRKGDINLIKNPHRYAEFRVLRAPDIPSILIELGYLSNLEDEKLISDPQWQKKIAELITGSVRSYANLHRQRDRTPS